MECLTKYIRRDQWNQASLLNYSAQECWDPEAELWEVKFFKHGQPCQMRGRKAFKGDGYALYRRMKKYTEDTLILAVIEDSGLESLLDVAKILTEGKILDELEKDDPVVLAARAKIRAAAEKDFVSYLMSAEQE